MGAKFRAVIATVAAPTVYLAELPFTTLEYGTTLNGAGTASVTLPLDSYLNDTATVAVGSTVLWIERDGALVFGGVIWTVAGDAITNIATITAGDFMSYLHRRTIRATQTFASTDQHDIARALVDYANGVTDALNIIGTAGTNTAGVTRDRTYPAWERKNVGRAIQQLAAVNNGFDYHLELTYVAGVPTVELILVSPNTGAATAHVFDLVANVEAMSFVADAASLSTQVDALGAGEGPDMLISTSTEASSGYALTQAAIAFSDVAVTATLDAHADRQLSMRRAPITAITAVVRPDVAPLAGTYAVGDIVEVRATKGFLAASGDYRITTLTTKFVSNQERITLTFAEASAFDTI